MQRGTGAIHRVDYIESQGTLAIRIDTYRDVLVI